MKQAEIILFIMKDEKTRTSSAKVSETKFHAKPLSSLFSDA